MGQIVSDDRPDGLTERHLRAVFSEIDPGLFLSWVNVDQWRIKDMVGSSSGVLTEGHLKAVFSDIQALETFRVVAQR